MALLLCLAQTLKSVGFETQLESQVQHCKVCASLHVLSIVVAGSNCVHADLANEISIVKHFSGASGPFSLSYSFNYVQGANFFRLVVLFMLRVIKKKHY